MKSYGWSLCRRTFEEEFSVDMVGMLVTVEAQDSFGAVQVLLVRVILFFLENILFLFVMITNKKLQVLCTLISFTRFFDE